MKIKECLSEIIELLRGIHANTSNNKFTETFTPQIKEVVKEVEVIKEVPVEVIKTVEKEIVKEVPDLFSRKLNETGIRSFQAAFVQDKQLVKQFSLEQDDNEAAQLIRLIASMSQWNHIEELWDIFAQRCKDEKRASSNIELSILKQSIELHNLIYQNRKALLMQPEIGSKYDYNKQTQGNTKGSLIAAVWLPELQSAGGEVRRKALVETN